MLFNLPIPKELRHLKLDERAYPIPFFVPIVDGKPNFKYADINKFNLCTEKHLCWVCGKKLNKDYFYFISGPIGLQNRIHSDPAMHKECALFTLEACPHLYFYRAERKTEIVLPYQINGKPDCLFVVKSSKYKIVPDGIGHRNLIKFNVVSTEKYIYVDNKLVKE